MPCTEKTADGVWKHHQFIELRCSLKKSRLKHTLKLIEPSIPSQIANVHAATIYFTSPKQSNSKLWLFGSELTTYQLYFPLVANRKLQLLMTSNRVVFSACGIILSQIRKVPHLSIRRGMKKMFCR